MSMELIDRKQLQIETQTLEDVGQSEMQFYSVEQVDNAPTVKAIPLEKLEQIRAEIESRLQGVNITLEILVKDDALIPRMEAAKTTLEEVLDIMDKAIKEMAQ